MIWFRLQAAILLLGNVEFAPGGGEESYDVEVIGKDELNSVANLLGISTPSLWQGLTTRTHLVRGQLVKSMSDANLVSLTPSVQPLASTRIFHGGGGIKTQLRIYSNHLCKFKKILRMVVGKKKQGKRELS